MVAETATPTTSTASSSTSTTKKGVVLVDTPAAAAAACARLRTSRLLAFDMEGAPLGQLTSLLQLAVSPAEVYVFDVLALGPALFDAAHLLPILTDPKTLKLCFDGRGDARALFHQHGVQVPILLPCRGSQNLTTTFDRIYT